MRRLALAPIAALGLVLALGVPAQAGFAPANDEIAAGEQLSANGLATDAAGRSIIVWSQETPPATESEVRARFLDPGGGLGPPIELAPGEDGRSPEVAMTPSGRAFAAWSTGGIPYSVKGRWIEPDGSLGPLLTLVEGGPDEDAAGIQVVVDPAGVATVAWNDQADFELNMRRVQPNGTLGTLVPDIADGGATGEEIAALPDGSTVAVWRSGGIEFNVVDANLTVGTPSQISEPGLVASPRIAVDSLGDGLAIWRMSVGEDDSLRGRRFDSTGAVGAELKIDPDAETEVSSAYDVAADTQGDFLAAWSREDAEEDAILYARRGDSLGVPAGPAQPLSFDGEDGIGPTAALEDGGTGSVVWRKDLGSGNYLTFGRAVDPLAAPLGGPLEIFAESGETEAATAPAIGFAAFLVEYPITGSARGAIVRRFMLPPTCSDSAATVVQGQPTAASLACTGLAIEGAQVLEQPQHGAVGPYDPAARTLTYTPTPGFEGTDSFTYAALNDGGGSSPARVSVAVGRDTIAPRITSLRFVQLRKKKKAGARAAAKKPKSKQRTYEFRLKFSEPATSRVEVERARSGIRKGRSCVKATKGKRGKSCTRWRSLGNVAAPSAGPEATLKVRGKLAKALRKGGRFRARALATDVAGNRSKPRTLGFRVKPSGR